MSDIRRYLFCLLFLMLPFSSVKMSLGEIPFYVPEMIILVLLGTFLWEKTNTKNLFFEKNKGLIIGGALFLIGAIISFIANPFSLTGLGMIKSWFVFPILSAGIFLFVLRESNRTNFYLLAWFVMTLGIALFSFLFFLQSGLTYDGRLQGAYSSPNFLAITLSPGILLALYFFWIVGEQAKKYFFLLTAFFLTALVFLTHSYAAWFALFCSVVFMYAANKNLRKKMKTSVLLIILIIVVAFFSFEKGTEKWQALVSFDERSSLSSRMMIWKASERILEDTFIFGIGVGRFQEVYLEYQKFFPPYLEWAVPQPHNFYLALIHQTGVLGFIGFLFLLYGYFSNLSRVIYSNTDEDPKELATVLFALMLLYLLYGFFDTPYFKTDLALLFWLLLSIGFSLGTKKAS